MRCALNGTQYTADALHHANQVESSACCFCGQPDSLRHRHWECPHFDDLRQQLPQLQHVDITENNATAFHGWVHSPSNLLPFRQELLQTPDTTCMFHPPPRAEEIRYVDLFLDGSCARPTGPLSRLASLQPLNMQLIPMCHADFGLTV